MTFIQFVFYVFAGILVFSAGMVITVRGSVNAALFLVLAFFTSAALWLLLDAEFLAVVLVLVYVGAVMVLFLFVVMMLDVDLAPLREGFIRHLPTGIAVAFLIAVDLFLALLSGRFASGHVATPIRHGSDYSNTSELGTVLYTHYVFPFEIAAVILLLAIVAAIALTLRQRPGLKTQDPGLQANVRREDRVRLVSMASEPRED